MRFEEFRHGIARPVIATFYHWYSPSEHREEYPDHDRLDMLTVQSLKQCLGPLYVCDDPTIWGSPHVKDHQLYAIDCLIRKPFPLFEQFESRELMRSLDLVNFAATDFDSIIYTPHPYGRGEREMALLYPYKQVMGCRMLPAADYIEMREEAHAKDLDHANWKWLMEPHLVRDLPPWEELRKEQEPARDKANFRDFVSALLTTVAQHAEVRMTPL